MQIAHPHFLLFSSAEPFAERASRWQFVLESLDGRDRVTARDEEPDAASERAELLAVVRGLEALEQPSRVTLVTPSRYVSRGIVRCLDDWRASQWRWERFGRVEPIRDHDLWRRIDRAMDFHQVDCHTWPVPDAAPQPTDTETASANARDLEDAAEVSTTPGDEPAVLIVRNRPAHSHGSTLPRRLLAACDAILNGLCEALAVCLRGFQPTPRST